MSNLKDGGPAFPQAPDAFIDRNPGGRRYEAFGTPAKGMSMRQYYAAKAMQALLMHYDTVVCMDKTPNELVAERAFSVADAMLKAEQEKP